MPFCPSCRAEYRHGIEFCAHCKDPLVAELPENPPETTLEGARIYIEAHTPTVMMVGALEACREIRDHLLASGVPCMITEAGEDSAELALMHQRFEVVIAEQDLPRVRDELSGRFEALLANEGVEDSAEAVEISAGAAVTCPACTHHGRLVEDACAECGLFLGAG